MEYDKFMSVKEREEAVKIIASVNASLEDMDDAKAEWANAEIAYLGEQPVKDGTPGTRVNVTLANVEGQAAEMSTKDISVVCIGQSKNDHEFAEDARVNLDWDIRHQEDLFGTNTDAARRLLKFGTMCLKTCYDPYAFDEFGVPRLEAPSIDRVVVDRKITSYRRLQDAEFIAEYIPMGRAEAVKWYGEDKAEAIAYGHLDDDDLVFKDDEAFEDDNSWTMIQYWTKDEGKLRLREYANCGLLLYDSFKGDDRKENQRTNKVRPNSYYTHVYDRYPYIFRVLYPREGKFYGMGDVKLISTLQDMLNNFYDMIRISARPNQMLVDSSANIDADDIGKDSFDPIYFDSIDVGVNNRDPIRTVSWGQVNDNWWRMIVAIHQEIQRVLRYSDLMLGYSSSGQTATEAAIQQQQGARASNAKQRIVESALTEAVNYFLGLDLQFRTGVKSMRLKDDKAEYRDINFDSLKAVPVMVPTEESVKRMYEENGNEPPEQQILTRNGKPVTKQVALDVKVNIGTGLPKNPAFLADLANKLATTVIMGKDGQPHPAMTIEEFRKFARDVMGFPLEADDEMMNVPAMPLPNMGATPNMATPGGVLNNPMDANSPLAQGGGVPMAPLAAIRNGKA